MNKRHIINYELLQLAKQMMMTTLQSFLFLYVLSLSLSLIFDRQ
jgi:hypothetical protein